MEVVSGAIRNIEETEAALVAGMTETEVAELRRLLRLAANNLGVCMPAHPQPSTKEEPHL